MTETNLVRQIMLAATKAGARLFRINTGQGWVGEVIRQTPTEITLRNYRPLHAGMVTGGSDCVGWTADGRFLAIEAKVGRRQPTPEQVAFVAAVNAAGGVGAVVWSVDDAVRAITSPP